MTPANLRDEIWKREGERMITHLRTNITIPKQQPKQGK